MLCLVSSAAIKSTSLRILSTRMVISSRFPIGVAQIYNFPAIGVLLFCLCSAVFLIAYTILWHSLAVSSNYPPAQYSLSALSNSPASPCSLSLRSLAFRHAYIIRRNRQFRTAHITFRRHRNHTHIYRISALYRHSVRCKL